MKKNIGTPDRIFRLVIALFLLGYAWLLGSWLVLAASAFVFFETFMSWCVLYAILGKSSCPRK
jgi:hypothetical protein